MRLEALQAVAALAGRSFDSFPAAVAAALAPAAAQLAGASVFVAVRDDGRAQWVVVDAAGVPSAELAPGSALDADGRFGPQMAGRAPGEPSTVSTAWVPLEGVDGEHAGALGAVGTGPVAEDDRELLGLLGRVLSSELRRRQHEERLLEQARNLTAVARAAREIADSGDARAAVCRAACEVSGSSFATLAQPDGPRHLRVTAASGIDRLGSFIPLDRRRALTARVFVTGEPAFVRNAQDHPATVRELIRDAGIVSVHVEPVTRDGQPVGVLSVGWSRPVAGLASPAVSAIRLLSTEAAIAIERSDARASLERLARADTHTGLPNRRAWDEHLAREIAAARRTRDPLVVVRLDLKASDDEAVGRVVAAWTVQLREVDLLARWTPEAFAVALPACDLEHAARVISRLRATTPAGASCTAGAAEWRPGESSEALIARAEPALSSGRGATTLSAVPTA